MKNSINLLIAAIALTFSFASSPALAGKYGVVQIRPLIANAPQNQTIRKTIEAEFKDKAEKLKAEQAGINELKKQLQTDAAIMAPAQFTAKKREIEAKETQFKLKEKAYGEDFQRRQQELMMDLQRQIGKSIEEFAKANGYDLIVTADNVAYATKEIDVTEAILKSIQAPGK